jgi:DNA-binding transcriptional MerR regulator
MRPAELAKITGVSTRVLRHYETKGLICSQRTENGYRNYSLEQIEKVKWVVSLIKCGFSTRQIAELANFAEATEMDDDRFIMCLAQHKDKLDALDALIEILRGRRNSLAVRINSFE